MIAFINKIRKSELVNTSVFTAIAAGVKLLTAFITAKIIAIYLGPEGLGLLGQLNSFMAIAMVLSTGAINNGVVKYLSEYINQVNLQTSIIKAAINITLICSLVVSLVIIIFSKTWSEMLFKSEAMKYESIIIIFGFTIFFYASFSLFSATLNGLKYFKKFNYLGIITGVIGLIFSLILIIKFNVYGALLGAVTYQSIVFFCIFIFKNNIKQLNYKNLKDNKPHIKEYKLLFKFSIMALVGSILLPISQIVIRNFITTQYSVNEMGLFEGINRLSNLYLTLITTTLSVYYLPKLSELTDKKQIKDEIVHGYKLIIPVTFVILLFVYLIRYFIIDMAFSSNTFSDLEVYFLPQLIGDFFKIASWLLAFQMVAKAMLKLFVLTEFFFTILTILLSYYLINIYGGIGAVYAYMVNYIVYFLVMLALFNKSVYEK